MGVIILRHIKKQDLVWLTLMALTLGSAVIAESADPGVLVILAIAATVMVKGRLVVYRFMELHNAHAYVRFSMMLYFYVLPFMIVVAYLFPEFVAALTKLS